MSGNELLYEQAKQCLVAGVGAAGRFNGSLGHPVYFTRGDGAFLWGEDGRRYLDFNLSHGATILGHNHPVTRAAILKALDLGVIAAGETEYTAQLARKVASWFRAPNEYATSPRELKSRWWRCVWRERIPAAPIS